MDDDRPYRLYTAGLGKSLSCPCTGRWTTGSSTAFLPEPDIRATCRTRAALRKNVEGPTGLDAKATPSRVLTCHPFLSGRPSRVRAIEKVRRVRQTVQRRPFLRADRLADLVLRDSRGEPRSVFHNVCISSRYRHLLIHKSQKKGGDATTAKDVSPTRSRTTRLPYSALTCFLGGLDTMLARRKGVWFERS